MQCMTNLCLEDEYVTNDYLNNKSCIRFTIYLYYYYYKISLYFLDPGHGNGGTFGMYITCQNSLRDN